MRNVNPRGNSLEWRVTALENELQKMRLLMETQQQTLARALGSAEAAPGGAGPIEKRVSGEALLVDSDSEESLDEDAAHEMLDEMVYSMNQSAWDASLFIGYSLLGVEGSVLLVAGFLVNLVLQFTIVTILFKDPAFGWLDKEDEVLGAWAWRLHYGHSFSNINPVTSTSLTARVCGQDGGLYMSSQQKSQFNHIDNYLDGGPMLSRCMVVLFTLTVCAELRDISYYTAGVLGIPRGSHTTITLVDGKPVLVKLSWGRAFMGCVIALLRTVIAFSLLYCGAIWLVNTIDLESLILNAVALAFVLDTDETVYTVFSPHRLDNLLDQLEPVPCTQIKCIRYIQRPLKFFVAVVWAIFIMFPMMDRVVDTQEEIKHALCGGRQDFVFSIDPSGALSFALTPKYRDYGDDKDRSVKADIAEARMNIINRTAFIMPPAKLSDLYPTAMSSFISDLREGSFQTVPSMASLASCEDSDFNFSRAMYLSTGNVSFFADMNNRTIPGCADAQQYCKMGVSYGVRMYCPETCGCNDPTSGLVRHRLADGCPASCQDSSKYVASLSELDCKDWSLQKLRQSDGWSNFFFGFKQAVVDFFYDAHDLSSWTAERLEEVDCPGMVKLIVDEFPEWDPDTERGQLNGVMVEFVCESIGGMCPETCWCTNASMQATWKKNLYDTAVNLFEHRCPKSCKPL